MHSIFDSAIDLTTQDGQKMHSIMACKPVGVVLKPDGPSKPIITTELNSAPTMERPPNNTLTRLHDEAMSYFVKEMYGEALTIFAEAFSLIHRYLQQDNQYPQTELEQNQTSIPVYSRRARRYESLREKFLILPNPLEPPDNSRFSLDQFSFITLYNVTLCTHLTAMTSRSRQQLQKSLQLWEMIYSLQWRDGLNLESVHTLAILNNMGQAHRLLGNEASSTKCYQNIERALTVLRERKEEVVFGGFFMYTAQLMLNPSQVASAA
jgi:hypothetical protein